MAPYDSEHLGEIAMKINDNYAQSKLSSHRNRSAQSLSISERFHYA